MTHYHSVRVYYEDTDAGGIVYYANYLKFFERARTEWLRSLGYEQDKLMEQSIAFVVKAVELNYIMPARFNELLSIESELVQCKGARLVFQQTIKNQQEQALVQAHIQVACVEPITMTPKRLPPAMIGELTSVF